MRALGLEPTICDLKFGRLAIEFRIVIALEKIA